MMKIPSGNDGQVPLSFAQQRLWFLDWLADNGGRTAGGSTHEHASGGEYLDPVALRVRGPLNVDALRDAFDMLATRHSVLRTRYAIVGGEPCQLIDDKPCLDFAYQDLSTIPDVDRQRSARETVGRETNQPFDLSHDHPLRIVLIKLSPTEHILLVVLHHIASDAWSRSIIARDLGELYSARCCGRPAELAPLALQYADFTVWQREQLSGAAQDRLLSFWRGRLAGLVPIELPTDRPRGARRDTAGAITTFTVPPVLFSRLTELGRRCRTTPFMTLLGGFFALLGRYCGQDDLAVGTPTAGRDRVEAEDLVGCFVNMLVMRADLAGEPSFAELLGRVGETALSAFEHREMQFEKLVDDLSIDRDLAVNPLFQVAFAWQNAPQVRFALMDLEVEPLDMVRTTSKFDLTLRLSKGSGGALAGELEYASALFDEATAIRFADHYVRLLERAVDRPDTAVSALDLLMPAERAALRASMALSDAVGSGLTGRDQEARPTLPGLFERQVASTPGAVAISCEGADLTYHELNRRADRLADLLRGKGVVTETLVGLYAEPGVDLIVGMIAILKAGGAYLPIDPNAPERWIEATLADAAPAVILGADHLLRHLRHLVPKVALSSWEHDEMAAETAVPDGQGGHIEPDQLAYVIYTSGSTGLPKGVMVTHANVVRLFTAAQSHFTFDAHDVWTLFHSAAFDFSVWEIWGALLHGGRLVVVPPLTVRSPEALAELLADQRVSVLNQTPSAFRGLLDTVVAGNVALDDLRLVVFGGEALDMNSLTSWFDRYVDGKPELVNMYGITETTVHVTYRHLSRADLGRRNSPIGRPLNDLRVLLLDAVMNPVPDGMPGEIYVAGHGLARGYLNRPRLTAQRFVADPFSDRPGACLYRTGDRARRLAGGDLEYLGRVDDQIKIRGFRVELGEIEAALNTHPAVSQSAVAVHEPQQGQRQLVAYIVAAAASGVLPAQMRAHVAERLPGYMVPTLYISLPALPRTVGGKLDRKALPTPHATRSQTASAQDYIAPRSPHQIEMARTWSAMLGLDRIGLGDDFFELGGDSIRAVRLVGALREQGWDITVELLFRHRTIGRLCEILDLQGRGQGTMVDSLGVAPFSLISATDRSALPAGIEDAYPLSLTQAGMLFEMMASPEAHPYHNIVSYPVRNTGEFCTADLERAIDIVVKRNEILRTSFDLVTFDEPLQLVHREVTVPLTVCDLRAVDADQRLAAIAEMRQVESERLLDVSRPPMLRINAHILTDDRWMLTLTESHAILDGWSYHSLVSELLHQYGEIRKTTTRKAAASLASTRPPVRFADFIALEQQALHDEDSRAFWRDRVTDFDPVDVPYVRRADGPDADDSEPSDGGNPADDIHSERVPYADLESGLRALASAETLPFKTVLLTAHLAALAKFTGKARIMSGLVCNGRPEVRAGDQMYGMFLNTVPFCIHVTGRWVDLLPTVYEEELAVWPHRRYPLFAMQKEWGGQNRLLDVLFSYMDFSVPDQRLADLVDIHGIVRRLPVDFALSVSTEPGAMVVSGRTDRVSPETVRRLATNHRHALETLAVPSHDGESPLLGSVR